MPTPSSSSNVTLAATIVSHASCPPDDDRTAWRGEIMQDSQDEVNVPVSATQQPNSPTPSQPLGSTDTLITEQRVSKRIDTDEEVGASEMMSPMSAEGEKPDERDMQVLSRTEMGSSSMGYDFSNIRLIPSSPSCFLRAGSTYRGTQKSERQKYEVQVDIKHVDMRESFLCGYLRIKGLTEDHPTLTTYFEGEIIGPKYTFLTQHQDWGSTDKVDLQHWGKFTAFRQHRENIKKGHYHIRDPAQRETIFMRWKEHFLVPDHRVRTISGASFEGFYYICFNQIKGTVSGVYFHAKSERFQQLELEHVPDRGCYAAMEFR